MTRKDESIQVFAIDKNGKKRLLMAREIRIELGLGWIDLLFNLDCRDDRVMEIEVRNEHPPSPREVEFKSA